MDGVNNDGIQFLGNCCRTKVNIFFLHGVVCMAQMLNVNSWRNSVGWKGRRGHLLDVMGKRWILQKAEGCIDVVCGRICTSFLE